MLDVFERPHAGASTELPCPTEDSPRLANTVLVYVASTDSGGSATGPAGHGAVIHLMRDGMAPERRFLSGGHVTSQADRETLIGILDSLHLIRREWPSHTGGVIIFTNRRDTHERLFQARNFWQHNDWKTRAGFQVRNPNLWRALIEATAGRPVYVRRPAHPPFSIRGSDEALLMAKAQSQLHASFLDNPERLALH
jgi:ribonuclease HI